MLNTDLSIIRRDYSYDRMTENGLLPDPLQQLSEWIDDVIDSPQEEPTAMILATVNAEMRPDARVVLLKGIDSGLVFFSNYNSPKGKQIELNNSASVVFHWTIFERQVRVKGKIEKTTREDSETYFSSRPLGSRLSAIVSKQSQKITSRNDLETAIESKRRLKEELTCPSYWGGYRLIPEYFEFWQGRKNRLHDRVCYEISDDGWCRSRLSP